jgi:hypothetical protein
MKGQISNTGNSHKSVSHASHHPLKSRGHSRGGAFPLEVGLPRVVSTLSFRKSWHITREGMSYGGARLSPAGRSAFLAAFLAARLSPAGRSTFLAASGRCLVTHSQQPKPACSLPHHNAQHRNDVVVRAVLCTRRPSRPCTPVHRVMWSARSCAYSRHMHGALGRSAL